MSDGFGFGEYVMYDSGHGERQIGRVTSDDGMGFVHVCYHDGCTASATPRESLRTATEAEIDAASPNIGFHRFDARCPEYDRDACFMCGHAGYGQ